MTLAHHLDRLETSGLVARLDALEYLFRHALVQDAAYASLLRADRRVLHRAVGETLEALYAGRREELAATLAHHFLEAGEPERALDYLLLAGARALEGYALREAVELLQRAARLAEQAAPETRRRALELLGDAHVALGENDAALAAFAAALPLCARGRERAALHNRIGYVYHMHMGDYDRALQEYQQGLAELDADSDELELARVRLNLGYYYAVGPHQNPRQALACLDAALPVFEHAASPGDMAICLAYMAFAFGRLAQPAQTLAHAQRALELCERYGLLLPAEPAYSALGHAYQALGDYARALECYRASVAANQRTGVALSAAYGYQNLFIGLIGMHQWEEAISIGRLSLELWQRLGWLHNDLTLSLLSVAYDVTGQAAAAAETRAQALANAGDVGRVRYTLACGYALAGRRDQALAELGAAMQHAERWRDIASRDRDFNALRDDPEFQRLLAPPAA
jgi:predicted ATPase